MLEKIVQIGTKIKKVIGSAVVGGMILGGGYLLNDQNNSYGQKSKTIQYSQINETGKILFGRKNNNGKEIDEQTNELESKVIASYDLQKKQKKCAVIINSGDLSRHVENVSFAYDVLTKNLEFDKEDIFIFDSNKNLSYPVNGESSRKEIFSVFERINNEFHPSIFLLYVTGHGDRGVITMDKNDYIVKCKNEKNKDSIYPLELLPNQKKFGDEVSILPVKGTVIVDCEFNNKLSMINSGETIAVFDQCFGGGFSRYCGGDTCVSVSGSAESQPSYSNFFPRVFFDSFTFGKADVNPYDGRISVGEAFDAASGYSKNESCQLQTPQIFGKKPYQVFLK